MSTKQNEQLDNLVKSGDLQSYSYQVSKEKFCNYETLSLVFPSGKTVKLETYCSGVSEDTGVIITSVKE